MKHSYQDYEIRAYFGDFYDDYAEQAKKMIEGHDWETIVYYMDDELREAVHAAIAPCDNERFLLAYMMAHTERYGADYEIS